MNKKKYADVYVGYPVEGSYTYSIPEDLEIQPGKRVRVNFRNRFITAFVHRVHNTKPDFKDLKEILKVIDTDPIFDKRLIDLSEYTASSYLCNTGEVLATALPSGETPSDRYKNPFKHKDRKIRDVILNEEQSSVYKDIIGSFNNNQLYHLIFGITGSGKTEIYIELAKHVISLGRSVIYLVPEITLSSQIFERLYNVFYDDLIVYHSQLTANQRLNSWIKFYNGDVKIAVGTRSAVFLQCPELGLIIIDEEHDLSYKEHSTPRYHTKRLAYYRCMQEKSLLVLGSATPSIESFYFAESGKMNLYHLKGRFGDTLLPEIEIVKINPKKSEMLISNKLIINSKKALAKSNQAIFLLNRRGFSPIVLCNDCGNVFECPYCNISLNLHKSKGSEKLICHYCGFQRNLPDKCTECESENVISLGAGTQKVEDTINETFKEANIVRLDQDTTRKKSAIFEIVEKMTAGEIDILLGTQMVAKGFDFHNVSIVGVLLADIGLNMPDFRASERIFSLLIQVAGRCGRRNERGKVIIQTLENNNYLYGYLKNHDYPGFYRHELAVRRTLQYPPFSRMARLLVRGKTEDKVIKAIDKLYKSIENEINKKKYNISLLGPVAAPFPKISSNYRYHIILKAVSIEQIREVVKTTAKVTGRDLYLEIDIDPYDIL